MITTPNLASVYNRIALLFGFQPFATRVSLIHPVGHLIEPPWDKVIYTRETEHSMEHIKVFTLRSLKALVKLHGFTINRVKGYRVIPVGNSDMRFSHLVQNVDRIMGCTLVSIQLVKKQYLKLSMHAASSQN